MSGSPLAVSAVVALAVFSVFASPLGANEAAHKMAEKFASPAGADTKGKTDADRKAEADTKAAAEKKRKAEAQRKAAELRRRAEVKAMEDARRAGDHRRADEAEMLTRARREAEERRSEESQADLTAEARRLIAEAERERAKTETLIATEGRFPPERPQAQREADRAADERLAQQRAEEARRLAEKLKRVRQLRESRLAKGQPPPAEPAAPASPPLPPVAAAPEVPMGKDEPRRDGVGLRDLVPPPEPRAPVHAEAETPPAPVVDERQPAAVVAEPMPAPEAVPRPDPSEIARPQEPAPEVTAAVPPPPAARHEPSQAREPLWQPEPRVASGPRREADDLDDGPWRAPGRWGDDRRGTRYTVLLIMEPGSYGIRRRGPRVADPLLCVEGGCYVSTGPDSPAVFLPGRKATGIGNTLGFRAGACRHSLGCVFRGVDLGPLPGYVQPVDLHIFKHDRRMPMLVRGDSACRGEAGRLACRHGITAPSYTLWIVPERLAASVGPGALQRAVEDGLNGPHSAGLAPRWLERD